MTPFNKDLLTAIRESWKHFDKEYLLNQWNSCLKELWLSLKLVERASKYLFLYIVHEFYYFFLNIRLFRNIFLSSAWKIISLI